MDTERSFEWSKLWTRLFVIVVVIGLSAQVYMFLAFRAEIRERRLAFCLSENESNRKQTALWEGVIRISQDDEARQVQTPAEADAEKKQLVQFRQLLKSTFPQRNCKRF